MLTWENKKCGWFTIAYEGYENDEYMSSFDLRDVMCDRDRIASQKTFEKMFKEAENLQKALEANFASEEEFRGIFGLDIPEMQHAEICFYWERIGNGIAYKSHFFNEDDFGMSVFISSLHFRKFQRSFSIENGKLEVEHEYLYKDIECSIKGIGERVIKSALKNIFEKQISKKPKVHVFGGGQKECPLKMIGYWYWAQRFGFDNQRSLGFYNQSVPKHFHLFEDKDWEIWKDQGMGLDLYMNKQVYELAKTRGIL